MDSQDLLDWAPLAISIAALVLSLAAVTLPYLRRPKLSVRPDTEQTHSRVEGNGIPHLRLPVRNAKRRRSAKQARAVLDGYRLAGTKVPLTRLGSPFLGWPSVFGQDSDSYVAVIFSDAERPVGLGRFSRVKVDDQGKLLRQERYSKEGGKAWPEPAPVLHFPDDPDARWRLHLELADNYEITDERDWLSPDAWTVRLIVGADDGDARPYSVGIAWEGDEADADAILQAALDSLEVRPG